jgi:hypothetical protein
MHSRWIVSAKIFSFSRKERVRSYHVFLNNVGLFTAQGVVIPLVAAYPVTKLLCTGLKEERQLNIFGGKTGG